MDLTPIAQKIFANDIFASEATGIHTLPLLTKGTFAHSNHYPHKTRTHTSSLPSIHYRLIRPTNSIGIYYRN